jgi:hypothetical protein
MLRSALPDPLMKKFSGVAMPGERFNAGDVGEPGAGFLFVWNRQSRWIMAIERGGIVTRFSVQVFRLSHDGKSAVDLTPTQGGWIDPCPLALKYARQ